MKRRSSKSRILDAVFAAACALAAAVLPAHAQNVPAQVHFQGRLTDASNNPLSGPQSFVFGVYDAATGGNLLWSETQPAVPVANGVFAAQLGSVTPLLSTVFSGSTAYLQVTVNGNVMLPREQLLSAPYAHEAQLLGGRSYAAFVSTDATVQNIAGAKIFASSVTASAFFGDGSHLTGIASGSFVPIAGGAMTGQLTISGASETVTGAGGLGVSYGLSAGSATLSGGLTASSATFTATGSGQYALALSTSITFAQGAGNGLGIRWGDGTISTTAASTGGAPSGGVSGYDAEWTGAGSLGLSSFYETASSVTALGSGGLGVSYGLNAGSATINSGLTASSGTFTATGATYSVSVSSGISMTGPAVFSAPTSTMVAAEFIGSGAGLTNVPAGSPTGAAGGNLAGNYPNPIIGPAVIVTTHIANGAVGDAQTSLSTGAVAAGKFGDNRVAFSTAALAGGKWTDAQVAITTGAIIGGFNGISQLVQLDASGHLPALNGSALTNLPAASGAAGGNLAGSYPNPIIGPNVILSTHIANGAVGDAQTSLSTGAVAAGKFGDNRVAFSTAALAGGKWTDAQVAITTGAIVGGFNGALQLVQLNGAGNLQAPYGLSASSATIIGGLTASSGTFTATGTTYSVSVSSGITMTGPAVFNAPTSTMVAAEFVGSGAGLTNVAGTDNTKVAKAGDAMTGPLTLSGSTLTVTGNAFSVGGSTLIVTNGNVGIGTVSPSTLLHISTAGAGSINLLTLHQNDTTANDEEGILFRGNGSNILGRITAININPGADRSYLRLYTTNANTPVTGMTIDYNGDVGIGSDNPSAKLEVAGNGAQIDFSGGTDANRIVATNSGTSYMGMKVVGIPGTLSKLSLGYTGNPLTLITDVLTVTDAGRVGIGTASPGTMLHVSSGVLTVDGTGAAISVPGSSVTASAFFGDGSHLSGVNATDNTKVAKTGDTMTGQLTLAGSTLTVTGNAFSVGGSTLAVSGGSVGIGVAPTANILEVGGTGNASFSNSGYVAILGLTIGKAGAITTLYSGVGTSVPIARIK